MDVINNDIVQNTVSAVYYSVCLFLNDINNSTFKPMTMNKISVIKSYCNQ